MFFVRRLVRCGVVVIAQATTIPDCTNTFLMRLYRKRPSTTALATARAEGLDLVSVDEPEHEILKEPAEDLAMGCREGSGEG